MPDLITLEQFRDAARRGRADGTTVQRLATSPAIEVAGQARTLRFCFSDGSVDRVGDLIEPQGWDLEGFLANPVALWAHMSWDPPIGRAANVGVVGKRLMGDIEFAPIETYEFADTIYRLAKGGFINATSVGFRPLEWSFTNDKDRPYGIDFQRQELLEISVCPVPCNANALVEARAKGIDTRPLIAWAERVLDIGALDPARRQEIETLRRQAMPSSPRRRSDGADWKCGASRDLPIDEADGWDGPAAEASIFEHAGGDEFDPAKARAGFLLYDAAKPKLRGSYKEPFARVVGGELKASAAGIRAAASRLPQVDGVPDSAKDAARAVLDHYEEKMKDKAMGEGTNGGGGALVMGNCGRAKDEECGMKDPEECSIHRERDEDTDDEKVLRVLRRLGILKAGRVLSTANAADLRKAAAHHAKAADLHEKAMDAHLLAMEHHKSAHELIKGVLARHDAADDPDQDGSDDAPPDAALQDAITLIGHEPGKTGRAREIRDILGLD